MRVVKFRAVVAMCYVFLSAKILKQLWTTTADVSPPSLIAYGFLLDDELLPYFLSEARRIYGQVGGNGLRKVRWWSSVPGHHVGKMFNWSWSSSLFWGSWWWGPLLCSCCPLSQGNVLSTWTSSVLFHWNLASIICIIKTPLDQIFIFLYRVLGSQ